MRPAPRSAVLPLLGLGCALAAAAQKPAPQREIIVVVSALPQPQHPIKAATVSLWYLDSGAKITDARQVTNSQGQALLAVSPDVALRGDLRVEIAGAGGMAIYQPAGGQLLTGISPSVNTIVINLLPVGSPGLLCPECLEATLRRMSLQMTSQQRKIAALQGQVSALEGQKPDLGAALAEWAQANGFSAAQVNEKVQQWAEDMERRAAGATAEQKALAEFALNHYANAAQLFHEASDADRQEIGDEDTQEQALEAQVKALQAAQLVLLDKERNSLRQLLRHSEETAGADQLNLEFHAATQILESTVATAEAQYRKHPGDKSFQEFRLQAIADAADARRREGEGAPADQSLALLVHSADDFASLVRDYAALGDARESAAAQSELGDALADESSRVSGDKAAAFYDQAAQAYQSALAVRTRNDLPQEWAATQNHLGIALVDEAERVSGDKATALFDQAVQAFHQALEVVTKPALPQEWARIQFNLGTALTDEGERAVGARAAALLDTAVQTFAKALEVYNKSNFPEDWAVTQDALGLALMEEGLASSEQNNAVLLDQSVKTYRSALEVITQAALPQEWAQVQNNLGSALEDEAIRASDDQAPALFEQAEQAYENALEVYTKANLPQDWGRVENNLGLTFMQEGLRTRGAKAGPLLAQSVQAFQSSLEVFTKADLPQYWATVEMNLGDALAFEALHSSPDNARDLFEQAIVAYQKSLEVRTRATLPEDWAEAQMNIMEISFLAARYSTCKQQVGVLTDDALSPPQAVVRDTIELACQWGAGDKSAAGQTEKLLLSKSASLHAAVWDFSGSLQILAASPSFADGRPSWIALFTAVQNGDSPGMTAALRQLEPVLQR